MAKKGLDAYVLKTDTGEIRIFLRDEKKQDYMLHNFQVRMLEVASKINY